MPRGTIYENVTRAIGETPLIYLNKLTQGLAGRVAVKHEGFNPFNSVKDRIGVSMVEDAIKRGLLKPGMVIVEPTSGNTGIGLAFAAAVHGYRCILTMPETMTLERRAMLRALGAKVFLTEASTGIRGSIAKAEEIAAEFKGKAWIPMQFKNEANPRIHYETTGPEIWKDTEGKVDFFVSGVGTGGTITGAGKYLKEQKSSIKVVAVEPAESPVLSGGQHTPHKQQGIGTGFVPEVLDTHVYDEVITVSNDAAFETTRRLAREEAIFAGISSGSITWAALQLAKRPENKGKLIVSIIADFGERYLSNPVFAEMPEPE
jgi:cysteine synthase A